jgi:hypothetical protein
MRQQVYESVAMAIDYYYYFYIGVVSQQKGHSSIFMIIAHEKLQRCFQDPVSA